MFVIAGPSEFSIQTKLRDSMLALNLVLSKSFSLSPRVGGLHAVLVIMGPIFDTGFNAFATP